MQKIKMKADGRIGFLTGKKKKRAGKTLYQIYFLWTKEDLKQYKKEDPNFRPKQRGFYDWQKMVMFDIIGEAIKITESEKKMILAKRKFNTEFYNYIAKDFKFAKSVIKRFRRYTEKWSHIEFPKDELKWLKSVPIKRKVKDIIYRGMFVQEIHKFPKGKTITLNPLKQFSSWTTSKKNVDYFLRGKGWPVTLKAKTPKNIFYVQGFFDIVNELGSDLHYKEQKEPYVPLSKEEVKIMDLLSSIQLYAENEIWIFGKIRATVIK